MYTRRRYRRLSATTRSTLVRCVTSDGHRPSSTVFIYFFFFVNLKTPINVSTVIIIRCRARRQRRPECSAVKRFLPVNCRSAARASYSYLLRPTPSTRVFFTRRIIGFFHDLTPRICRSYTTLRQYVHIYAI